MPTPRLSEFVDLLQIKKLLDAQSEITGMPMGLMDCDGTLLLATGWREICTRFHRVHPESQARCQAFHCSPMEGSESALHACPNGLWDLRVPIRVAGEHVASLMLGQFRFEGETREASFFRRQAETLGYDVAAYFEALSQVPTFTREEVRKLLDYTQTLVGLLTELGYQRVKSERAEKALMLAKARLEDRVAERTLDISRAHEALRQSEDKYRSLVEQLNEGILAVDLEVRITYSNPRMAEMLGRKLPEMSGRPFTDFMDAQSIPGFLERMERRKQGIGENYELPLIHRDGRRLLFSVSGMPLKDRRGKVIGAYAIFSDITERRQAEEALRESEARFRKVFENMQDVFYRSDIEGRLVLMSPSGARILGYDSPEEVLGQPISETMYLDPKDRSRFLEGLQEKGFVRDFEETMRRKDGSIVIVSTNSHYYRDEDGRILGVEGVFYDITERKRAEAALRASEARYRRLVDHVRDIIYSYLPDGRISFVSESIRTMGYESEEVVGRNLLDFVHPEDQGEVTRALVLALDAGLHERIECRLRRQDGGYEWYEEFSEPLIVDGVLVQVNGVLRNIADRKAAELSLRESEEMYRALAEHSHDGIFIFKRDRFLFVNRVAGELTGFTLDELYGMQVWDLVHPEDRDRLRENALRRILGENVPSTYSARILHRSGETLYVEFAVSRIPFQGDGAILGTVRDVTERLKAEEALRDSEERYRSLVENQGEGVGYVDAEEVVLFMNRAAEEIFGRPRADMLGHPLSDFMDEASFSRIRQETESRKSGAKSTYEVAILRPDGSRRRVLVTATPIQDDDHNYLGALGLFRDITSIKETEAQLRRLSKAIEQASDSILIADTTGRILYANPATERLLGIEREGLEGRAVDALGYGDEHQSDYLRHWRTALDGEPSSGKLEYRHSQGGTGQTDATFSPVRDETGAVQYVVLTSRDVTREMELEGQLRHAQKMEAIGVLAGGIAHDFNNILMPILGFTELAMDRVPSDQPKLGGYLKEIQNAGRRAADLVRQILTFSRQVEQVKKPVRLHPIVKECLKLMRAAIPATIPIQASLDENCGPVLADPSQIHQVVMNLCTNAYHAMRENGGRLEVTLDTLVALEPLQTIGGQLPPGNFVRIRISDTGCGIGPETQKKIFLPFFTTKKVGEGTGLGLSIVHGIVTGSGGGMTLESEVGQGSAFTVYLPVAPEGPEGGPDATAPILRGSERILVVDDEEPIGQMLGDALDMLGYRVTILTDSNRALTAVRMDPGAFDLVLTDFTMPGLTGPELADRIWERCPDLPVILMTGYSEDLDEERARDLGFARLLRKPLPLAVLAEALREAFDPPACGPGPIPVSEEAPPSAQESGMHGNERPDGQSVADQLVPGGQP